MNSREYPARRGGAGRQHSRIARLHTQRKKLLEAHHEDSIPLDLFREEQVRINRELIDAQSVLANAASDHATVEECLVAAGQLARSCGGTYD